MFLIKNALSGEATVERLPGNAVSGARKTAQDTSAMTGKRNNTRTLTLHVPDFLIPETANRVVVDHADGLHQRVTDLRTHKFQAALQHGLAPRVGLPFPPR